MPASIKAYLVHTSPNTNVLNIQRWAIYVLNVLPYPETRVYKEIAKAGVSARNLQRISSCWSMSSECSRSKPETGFRCWDL